uniref:Uncharacterized protein n=1 Tax=Arion vulgaris TaxID=1028688 RepID=A0A0B7B5E4_9EUPU
MKEIKYFEYSTTWHSSKMFKWRRKMVVGSAQEVDNDIIEKETVIDRQRIV